MPGDNEPDRSYYLQKANGYGRDGFLTWPSDHWFMIKQAPINFIGFKIKSSVGINKVSCWINNTQTQKIINGDTICEILLENPEEFTPGDIDNMLTITPETYHLTAPMEVWFICGEK